MEYSFNEGNGTARAVLRGSVTYRDAIRYKDIINGFNSASSKAWEFDLGAVEFLDSTGMSLFVLAHDAAKAKGATISLRGARDGVLEGLKRARFDQLMTIA